jgi:hypothetical protein
MRRKIKKQKSKGKTARGIPRQKILQVKVVRREIMISVFDLSTVMAKPWAQAGYLCYCIDLQHPPGEHVDPENENIIRVGANIEDWQPPAEHQVVFASFFPPCTDVAVSGARWFRIKGLGKLERSIGLFYQSQKLAELLKCPYLIENPVSTISSHWRRPDYTFHPCHYGNRYLKRTCLWVGGGFVMPSKTPVKPTQGMKLYWLGPSEDRANLRSETPTGFARAVFKANDPQIKWRRIEKWRNMIRRRWNDECAVTGIRSPHRAAHIIQKFDGEVDRGRANGIALAPHIHELFDHGLIAFDDKGCVLVSSRLPPGGNGSAHLPSMLNRPPTAQEKRLFRQHRENVFLGT